MTQRVDQVRNSLIIYFFNKNNIILIYKKKIRINLNDNVTRSKHDYQNKPDNRSKTHNLDLEQVNY